MILPSISQTACLDLLLPGAVLPTEGTDDFPLPPAGATSVRDWLAAFQKYAAPLAPRFVVDNGAVFWDAEAAALGLTRLISPAEGHEGEIVAASASTQVDWTAATEAVERKLRDPACLGTPEDAVRLFFAEARRAVAQACTGFAGEPVPLLATRRLESGAPEIAFLGVWLAQPADLQALQSTTSARPWDDDAAWTDATTLILDTADAEGRGIREMALGVALLAVAMPGEAKAGFFNFFQPPVLTADGRPADRGEELVVKSQKLRQPSPKIYRTALKTTATDSQRKVIVDIAAQRAYLFVDGQLAFETPVSTASAGRYTPRGTFSVSEKVSTGKISTIYKSPMPHWMRLGSSPIGMHTGQLPGYPASHGCVRMPDESAAFLFSQIPRGTTVQVVDSIAPPSPPALVAAQ